VSVGDFDADGKLDLGVTSNSFYTSGYYGAYIGHAHVLVGNGDGSFVPSFTSSEYMGFLWGAVIADFNGDGNADFAAGNYDWGTVSVMLGDGAGGLGPVAHFSAGAFARAVTAADLNGDGKMDLATPGEYGISVLLGSGASDFSTPQLYTAGLYPSGVATADFNGDGALDFAVANSGSASLSVLFGVGDGTFRPPTDAGTGALPFGVTVGDFNGDGRPVAATANGGPSTVSVLLNNGTWSPLPPPLPVVRIGDRTLTEGNAGTLASTFTVTLSAASTELVTIAYATASGTATAGSDYQAATGTLVIPAGQTTGTITVLVNGDRLAEPNETYFVNLSGATGATIADGQGVGTIVDNEPRIGINDVTKAEGRKGRTTLFTFTVTLSAAYDQPVSVSFQTVNGTAKTSDNDYIAKTGSLTFAAGETTKTITIEVKGDSKRETNETFYLDLIGLSSNASFTKSRGIGTILNDD
jgi:hypothetical protein